VAQLIGSLTCIVVVLGIGLLLMYAVKATGTLRVSRDGELEGIDIHEHGTPAYHLEFGQGATYTTLLGAGRLKEPEDPKTRPVSAERETV
jgi:hypothetical protein